MVGNLLTVFEKATERYLDQVTSSDEEIAVEYPDSETDEKVPKQKKSHVSSNAGRKPTLAAQTDKKRESSFSEDSVSKRSNSLDSVDQLKNKRQQKRKIVEETKPHKKTTKPAAKTEEKEKQGKKKNKKNAKVGRKPTRNQPSPVRTRSHSRSRSYSSFSREEWSSSPPPSWPPSSPDSRIGSTKRKHTKSSHVSDEEPYNKFKGKFVHERTI